MVAEIRCTNPLCGHPSPFGPDSLGRTFRCGRCGTKLPRRTIAAAGIGSVSTSADEDWDLTAPWETEERASGWSLGAALPTRIGRYLVREKLGAGSSGTVYRALDPELQREVALKVPHAGSVSGETARERFLGEARALARLDHPRIIPVFDLGKEGGTPYLATACVSGRALDRCLEDDGPLHALLAAEIAAGLAEALDHAHGHGVVHRDVKPANVLVDDRGGFYLTDFSLARHGTAGPPAPGLLFGTPAYLAPEQADDQTAGLNLAASDQYSLGVVLYEMLCGRPPFLGPPQLVLYYARHDDPIPPHVFHPGVPRSIERICLKAMHRNPGERFPDCAALADELRNWATRARKRASTLDSLHRVAAWSRRRPAAALSAMFGAFGVVATTVLASALITSTAFEPVPTHPDERPLLVGHPDHP